MAISGVPKSLLLLLRYSPGASVLFDRPFNGGGEWSISDIGDGGQSLFG